MRGHIPYSAAEMAWLEANRMMVISDYHRAFVARFRRADVTAGHLHELRKRKSWKVGRSPDRYKGRGMKYTPAEVDWLRDHCTLEIGDLHSQFIAAFPHHYNITVAKVVGMRKRYGLKTGRTGRFEQGHEPWTKGKKLPFNERSARHQFKKGQIPHTFKGSGYERIDGTTGYVVMIVDEKNPWTGAKTRPVQKHIWLWTQQNGPVPKGHVLKCLDGNRQNTDPSNWEAIPKGLLPRLNGKSGRDYDRAPDDLKPAIMAVAKIEHAVRERRGGRL